MAISVHNIVGVHGTTAY